MNIDQKINYRANAYFHLTWAQFSQLVKLKKLVLAPYYHQRLIEQGRIVKQNEDFKATFGKSKFEYENNI